MSSTTLATAIVHKKLQLLNIKKLHPSAIVLRLSVPQSGELEFGFTHL